MPIKRPQRGKMGIPCPRERLQIQKICRRSPRSKLHKSIRNDAIRKISLIDNPSHLVLTAPHPSPLSCHRGFFGSKPFSKINDFLVKNNLTPIDWR